MSTRCIHRFLTVCEKCQLARLGMEIATLRAENERLTREMAEARASDAESCAMYRRARDRAEAAEKRVAEFEAVLRRIEGN